MFCLIVDKDMAKKFTVEEIKWKGNLIFDELESVIRLNSEVFCLEDKELMLKSQFIISSLIYLKSIDAIDILFHKRSKSSEALFTTTRYQYEKASLQIEHNIRYAYEVVNKPSNRKIPIPTCSEVIGNEESTHISLCFKYPDSKIGDFCKRMIGYLRNSCKKDAYVIIAVAFMDKYYYNNIYYSSMFYWLSYAFVYDHWNSSFQYPIEVGELMDILLGEDTNNLYDPFMRTGINHMLASNEYHAQATNITSYYATMLIAESAGLNTKQMELADCIHSWNPSGCDTIIASPSFNKEIYLENGDKMPISVWALENVYKSLDKNVHKGLLLLPESILTSTGKTEQLRHDITESNLLDTVILLPANIFPKTGIATTIILLKSDRGYNDTIKFADFSSFFEEMPETDWDLDKPIMSIEKVSLALAEKDPDYICGISIDEIRKHGYEWFPSKYINKQDNIPSGYEKFKIKDFLQEDCIYDDQTGVENFFLTEAEMCSNPFKEYPLLKGVKEENIPNRDNENWHNNYRCSHTSRFVIHYSENTLKTYYYGYDYKKNNLVEEDYYLLNIPTTFIVPESYFLYHVDTELIHIGYLRMLLDNTYSEVQQIYSSASIEKLIDAFMNTEVIIPLALEEQERQYEQAKLSYIIEQAHKEGLGEAINSMKQEYMMEVRMRKHDMKPFISQLDSQVKLISFYVDKINGNEEIVSAIRQKLSGMSNAVSELRLHLNRLTEEEIYGTPELINPLEILNELTGNFSNYSVDVEFDSIAFKEAGIDNPEIYISKVDFSTLCTTIIENAVTHAFTEKGNNDYKVHISITYDKGKSTYIIDFMNNGSSMPLNMDKFRYGLKGEKGAKSKGSGLGGYRVKAIMHHFGGDYDVFCNGVNNLTIIRLYFPKNNNNE